MTVDNSPRIATKTMDDLRRIMAALRDPATGCPWDVEQDFATIAPYTIEEAYEVADAISRSDLPDLCDELGDLLLQVVFHAQMADEQGAFSFDDVVRGISEKMVRRHPHVFAHGGAETPQAVKQSWEEIKRAERASKARGKNAGQGPDSALDGVALALPALSRALKLQKRAAGVGFDWPDLAPAIAKTKEELDELQSAINDKDQVASEEEFGDLLFAMVNAARHLRIDPELALRKANEKFARRFVAVEARFAASGESMAQADLARLDQVWDEVKAAEKTDN
jgi:MazG family protein